MKWLEIRIIFCAENAVFAADLVSNVFYDLGLPGVIIQEAGIQTFESMFKGACKQPDKDAVIAYIPKSETLSGRLRFIKNRLAPLNSEYGIKTRIVCRDVDEEDWAESWKAFFWPQKIGKKIVVKPTWRDYIPSRVELVLEIDPGMAFGTGTHPTTRLCVIMMETYLQKGDTFLDIGTGSGVLMVAAARLGARKVMGVDNDHLAVGIAQKNLLQNRIEPEKFAVITGNLVETVQGHFDFVAANILTETIDRLLDSIDTVLSRNGIFICSGIIEENINLIVSKMEKVGFDILTTSILENWAVIVGQLKHAVPDS